MHFLISHILLWHVDVLGKPPPPQGLHGSFPEICWVCWVWERDWQYCISSLTDFRQKKVIRMVAWNLFVNGIGGKTMTFILEDDPDVSFVKSCMHISSYELLPHS